VPDGALPKSKTKIKNLKKVRTTLNIIILIKTTFTSMTELSKIFNLELIIKLPNFFTGKDP
jgi:hypothetical protein